jgi:membrane protein
MSMNEAYPPERSSGNAGLAGADPPRTPLWVSALAAALVLIGFRRHAPPSQRRDPARAVRERDRGRLASTPAEIPARGWKDVVLRVYKNIGEDRVVLIAAGVTFYSLLAIFPAIAALVALYGLFSDPTKIASHVDLLSGILPGGALDVVRDQMNRVAAQGQTKLGVTFAISLAVSLWSANAGIKSIFDALNLVYNEPEKRSFIRLNAGSLAFTVSAIVVLLIALATIVALPAALSATAIEGPIALVAKLLRWPAMLVVVSLALTILYRYGPSRAKAQWRWITWGSGFAAVAWLVLSILFSWYAASFGSFNKTYGSLGAIIGFMTWMWLSIIVVLLGAELDAEMEHQTARDTTAGRPKPLGSRGATMADTVGPAQS